METRLGSKTPNSTHSGKSRREFRMTLGDSWQAVPLPPAGTRAGTSGAPTPSSHQADDSLLVLKF